MNPDKCFMIRTPSGFGGNRFPAPVITVRRTAAIGDALCATIVANRLKERGFKVIFQTHPACATVLRKAGKLERIEGPGGACHVNLDNTYEQDPNRRVKHFHTMFFEAANAQLSKLKIDLGLPFNSKPEIDRTAFSGSFMHQFSNYPRPWVFVCPSSISYKVRQVPNGVWDEVAKKINGTCFWLGMHPGPKTIVDPQIRNLELLMDALSTADLLLTVDTGPMHIAAAMKVPIVAIGQSSSPELHLSDQRDFVIVWPDGLDCLNCQQNMCEKDQWMPPCQYVDPVKVANYANCKLEKNRISALIPTLRAPADRLNRAIESVLPEVDEVVVTTDLNGIIPAGALKHQKVRYVRKMLGNLGFGKNVNFGFRHTTGQKVLLLNDDAYVDPGSVKELVKLSTKGIGMVSHMLRYPSGKIYFAGRKRNPGERGCGHIDHGAWDGSIQQVSEMEAVSGTSVLIDRQAYYESGGFDERFYLYAEDDDISLRFRRHGFKLLYTPHVRGVHEGNATTGPTGMMHQWIAESGKLMEELWGPYWDWNKNRVPGNFDYLHK